ncbi:MAG: hypothetical protein ACKVU1_17120 [bacterium]
MRRLSRCICLVALAVATIASCPTHSSADLWSFTYQGRLKQLDVPPTGLCDFSFCLYDDPVAGNLFNCHENPGINVEDGLFTTTLNYGPDPWDGTPKWLEIHVRFEGDADWTILSPRQEVTAAPHSIYSSYAQVAWTGTSQWVSDGADLTYPGGGVGITGSSSPFASGKGVFLEGGLPGWANIFAYDYSTATPQTLALNTPGGRVGVGTTAPAAKLHSVTTTDAAAIRGEYNGQFGNGNAGVLGISYSFDTSGVGVWGTSLFGYGVRGDCQGSDGVYGTTANSFAAGGHFVNTAGGPALYAEGLAKVKTLQIIGGADIVEGFDTSDEETHAPGTVVVIDDKHAGHLRASRDPYDTKVAGVVSGAGGVAAGIRLAQEGALDGETPVAMTGRVYAKCSSENGPIRPGDLLTTSSTTGHAMRATDSERRAGAVIGKAMSALDGETGLVLVLVNLQ